VLARDLVELEVDVILTVVSGKAVAARQASSPIPIVMMTGGFPVEAGLVNSLGKPGGNVTGTTSHGSPELFGKYVDLLRTLSPQAARVGILWDYLPPAVTQAETDAALTSMRRAARTLGVVVVARYVRHAADVGRAVAQFSKGSIGALHVTSGPVHAQSASITILTDFTHRHRAPALSDFAGSGFFSQGGVLAYSPNPAALGRRAAYFVDRILRGTSPSVRVVSCSDRADRGAGDPEPAPFDDQPCRVTAGARVTTRSLNGKPPNRAHSICSPIGPSRRAVKGDKI